MNDPAKARRRPGDRSFVATTAVTATSATRATVPAPTASAVRNQGLARVGSSTEAGPPGSREASAHVPPNSRSSCCPIASIARRSPWERGWSSSFIGALLVNEAVCAQRSLIAAVNIPLFDGTRWTAARSTEDAAGFDPLSNGAWGGGKAPAGAYPTYLQRVSQGFTQVSIRTLPDCDVQVCPLSSGE